MGWSWGPWSPQSLPSSFPFSMTSPYICLFLQLFSSFLDLWISSVASCLFAFTHVFISYRCCNKWPQTWWLNGRNVFSHKSGGQTSEIKGQQVHTLSWGSRENLFQASSKYWWLPVFLGLWQHPSYLPLWSHCLLLFPWFPFKDIYDYLVH